MGTKIGKYEVQERLGIGGQAILYRCYDSLLDRLVAIKQISSHLAEDPKFLERFRKEAQVLARVGSQQPGIVTIFELIEDERGLFIVMEYVPGETLEAVLAANGDAVEPKATLQVLWRLAAALNDVHAAGIIHRDIKPGNIIVGEGLRPKITDFGVAASLTGQTSMLLGTTKYMAPELLSGATFDGRADIYSLGFVAYEMLTGRTKFNEIFSDIVRDKHSESLRWMKWHSNESVKAPPLSDVNPAVPPALSDIVAKMIAKNPIERFESMEALGRAIKTQFSLRAKAAAPAAPEPKKHRKSSKTHAPIGPAAVRHAVRADDGDDLDLPPTGPATAPLPKKKMSFRTKMILAGTAVFVLLAVGVTLAIVNASGQNSRVRAAKSIYGEGQKAFTDQDFKTAADRFDRLGKEFPETDQAAAAKVWLPFCEAHQAIRDGNWDLAARKEEQAEQERRKLNAAAKGDLLTFSREMDNKIQLLAKLRTGTRAFREAIGKAQDALKARQFDDARKALQDRSLTGATLTPEQARELQDVRSQIDSSEVRRTIETLMARAAEMATAGNFEDAAKALDEAAAKLTSPEAKTLPPAERDDLQAKITKQKATMGSDSELAKAEADMEQAKTAGDLAAELKAAEAAMKLKPLPKYTQRIKELNSRIVMVEGEKAEAEAQSLLGGGKIAEAKTKFVEARDKYNAALKVDDQNAAARKAVDRIAGIERREALVLEADTAMGAGKYDEALKKFDEAFKVASEEGMAFPAGIDAAVKTRMLECRYKVGLAAADRLRDQKKYDEAIAKYDELRGIMAEAGAEIDARQAGVKVQMDYDGLVSSAEQAAKEQRWDAAVDLFTKAQKKKDTPEIRKRITQIRYAEYMAKGKEAIDRSDWSTALGYLKIAQQNAQSDADKEAAAALIKVAEKNKKTD